LLKRRSAFLILYSREERNLEAADPFPPLARFRISLRRWRGTAPSILVLKRSVWARAETRVSEYSPRKSTIPTASQHIARISATATASSSARAINSPGQDRCPTVNGTNSQRASGATAEPATAPTPPANAASSSSQRVGRKARGSRHSCSPKLRRCYPPLRVARRAARRAERGAALHGAEGGRSECRHPLPPSTACCAFKQR
jgi:hypothetical protein